jgi:hypothetical protein
MHGWITASARLKRGRSLSFAKRRSQARGILACLMPDESTTPDLGKVLEHASVPLRGQ